MKARAKAKPKIQHPAQHERDAARRYLEHDHASETLSGEPAAAANRNAQAIDEEHGRARDIALTGTARELGKLPPHLRRHQLEARKRAGITAEDAHRIRHEYRTKPERELEPELSDGASPHAPRRERAREAAGAAATTGGRAAAAAYDAASDTSTGELVGELFMWGVGLSLLYLVLTRAAAVGKLFEGATNIARAVVSPVVDPLNPKGAL